MASVAPERVHLDSVLRVAPYAREAVAASSRFVRHGAAPRPTIDRVRQYFESRSQDDADPFLDFTESSSRGYERLFDAIDLPRVAQAGAGLLDVGCGRAGLLAYLNARQSMPRAYHGIDIDRLAIKRLVETRSSATTRFEVGTLRSAADFVAGDQLVAVVNVLPYCAELAQAGFDALCAAVARAHASLLVVDPLPGPTWDRRFGGMTITYRHHDRVDGFAAQHRLSLTRLIELHGSGLGPFSLFPIAYAALYNG